MGSVFALTLSLALRFVGDPCDVPPRAPRVPAFRVAWVERLKRFP